MRDPIALTPRGPFKGKSEAFHFVKWGAPAGWDGAMIESLVHHHGGGWGTFCLPGPAETIGWARKATKHPDAVVVHVLLARCVLFSQADLADAVWMQRRLLALCPHTDYPSVVNDFRGCGVLAVDVLQKRWAGRSGLRERVRAVAELRGLRDDLDHLQLDIVDAQYVAAREALAKRTEGWVQ